VRFPFTPYGYRELFLFGGVPLALAAWAWPTYGPLAALPFLLLTAFVVNFFRDPERAIPQDPGALVAPADGKVTAIVDCDEPEYLKVPAHKVGIFLNVFDVHVNRAPEAGVVEFVKYTKGKFLDARDPRCASENESNVIGIRFDDGRRALVRQVTGLIARRIVCGVRRRRSRHARAAHRHDEVRLVHGTRGRARRRLSPHRHARGAPEGRIHDRLHASVAVRGVPMRSFTRPRMPSSARLALPCTLWLRERPTSGRHRRARP
jgi:phosphatidylserine decarboxylase